MVIGYHLLAPHHPILINPSHPSHPPFWFVWYKQTKTQHITSTSHLISYYIRRVVFIQKSSLMYSLPTQKSTSKTPNPLRSFSLSHSLIKRRLNDTDNPNNPPLQMGCVYAYESKKKGGFNRSTNQIDGQV